MKNQVLQIQKFQLKQLLLLKLDLQCLQLLQLLLKLKLQLFRIACPKADGTLIPASLINSNEISINNISKIIGNGIFSLAATIANKSSEGMNSSWNIVKAKYKPGKNKVTKSAKILIIFKKLA